MKTILKTAAGVILGGLAFEGGKKIGKVIRQKKAQKKENENASEDGGVSISDDYYVKKTLEDHKRRDEELSSREAFVNMVLKKDSVVKSLILHEIEKMRKSNDNFRDQLLEIFKEGEEVKEEVKPQPEEGSKEPNPKDPDPKKEEDGASKEEK